MKTEILKVTPEMAKRFLANSSTKNRRVLESRVSYYADQMARGQWRLTGQGLSFDKDMNIIDGQHRLMAVIKSGKNIEFLIVYGVENDTFSAYDDGKPRGANDALYLSGNVKNADNIATIVSTYLQFKVAKKTFGTSSILAKASKQDIINEYYDSPDLFHEIQSASRRCYTKYRLFPIGKIGAIMAYLIKNNHKPSELVYSFFYELHGVYPDTNETTTNLREILIRAELQKRPYMPKIKELFIIKAWNAYYTRKTIKIFKVIDGELIPALI
jgi:hypothetical protein